MRERKIFSVLAVLFALVFMSTYVSAQDTSEPDAPKREMKRDGEYGNRFKEGKRGKRGMRGHRGDRGLMRMLRGLELTNSQKTQINTLMETNKSSQQLTRDEARGLKMKKRDGSITETEQQRLEVIHTNMKASNEQLRMTILALLTPDQTTKLEQMKADREQRREERRQRKQQMKSPSTDAPVY